MDVERCSGTIISIPFDQHKIDALFYGIITHKKHLEERPVILRLHALTATQNPPLVATGSCGEETAETRS